MSAWNSSLSPSHLIRLDALRRWVAAGCSLALLLLLLQPILCVVHCALHERAPAAADTGLFLCHASHPDGESPLLIPAFSPGLLPALALLAVVGSVCRLLPRLPRRPSSHAWAPPLPPPRSCLA